MTRLPAAIFRPLLFVSVLIAMADPWPAALQWQTQHIELTAKPGEKQATAVFGFRNTGQSPITILAVRPNCGCTAAEPTKLTYAPGEKGEIKATFTFEGRLGAQRKTVQVVTDDAPTKSVELVLEVTIPEAFTCTPRLLLWNLNGEKKEKAATISANGANRITSIKVTTAPTAEQVVARVEAMEEGKIYRVIIRPESVAKPRDVTIPCTATFADGTAQQFSVFAIVR